MRAYVGDVSIVIELLRKVQSKLGMISAISSSQRLRVIEMVQRLDKSELKDYCSKRTAKVGDFESLIIDVVETDVIRSQ